MALPPKAEPRDERGTERVAHGSTVLARFLGAFRRLAARSGRVIRTRATTERQGVAGSGHRPGLGPATGLGRGQGGGVAGTEQDWDLLPATRRGADDNTRAVAERPRGFCDFWVFFFAIAERTRGDEAHLRRSGVHAVFTARGNSRPRQSLVCRP
jgi:hypothetical protein